MSQQLISRSADLQALRSDGYDLEIRSGYLLLKNIPYVNSSREIRFGTLVSDLSLAGDVTARPEKHIAYFAGEQPCNKDGSEIRQIKHGSETQTLFDDFVVDRSFSNKPANGYRDYHHKMANYATIISSPAHSIDPNASATGLRVVETEEQESVFNYLDTASSRAGIVPVTEKLKLSGIAIVGLGGTGSYVLDLVAKTPVQTIHLFDGDRLLQHNAFRSPGAPSIEELRSAPFKVDYLVGIYAKMRRGLVAHPEHVTEANIDQLKDVKFVFLCLDNGAAKKRIVQKLEEWNIAFIDVGMGVELVDDKLHGILRTTTSTSDKREHVRRRISFAEHAGDGAYSTNIQIADLNALNAALAVIKWKKLVGFYADLEEEYDSTYTIDGNKLINEDQ